MYIYKTKWFSKWANKEGLTDDMLIKAIKEINEGLVDAELGGQVYKKRVATGSKGKSGGLRTILAFKVDDKAFFMFGFAKRQRDNIDKKELKSLKELAEGFLGLSEEKIEKALAAGGLIEVK